MNRALRLSFEWEDPRDARGPELRATWARFEIWVGDECVTRLEDLRAHSVRHGVYLPLYPLAEWIVDNWWALFNEVGGPAHARYDERHLIVRAAEGYALPALSIQTDHSRMILVWRPRTSAPAQVRFTQSGYAALEVEQVRDELRRFVAAVVERIREHGIEGTRLVEEWEALDSLDVEEATFCRVAGSLGLDPFSLDDADAEQILDVAQRLPLHLRRELFAVSDLASLQRHQETLSQFERDTQAQNGNATADKLAAIRGRLFDELAAEPWTQGYDAARTLRDHLSLGEARLRNSTDVAHAVDVDPKLWDRLAGQSLGPETYVNAIVGATPSNAPRIVTKYSSVAHPGYLFAACRALYEYLRTTNSNVALVTASHSFEQQRNRAFAAEFLVPAEQLRQLVGTHRTVTDDQVQEWASEFGASETLIRYQLKNHHIADVLDWSEYR